MKYILNFLILIILSQISITPLFSQLRSGEIKELKVGDKCPDFIIEKMIHYKSSGRKLSDFNKRLIIIDFWATWCSPCIDALVKLDTLQRQFTDQLLVLPVTYQSSEEVLNFLAINKQTEGLQLPSVTNDTILHKLFPHRIIPHEVWIGQDGFVLAITGHNEVNPETIKKYLESGKLLVKQKTDILNFDYQKPILFDGLNGKPAQMDKSRLISSSIFLRYITGLPGLTTGLILGDTTVMIKCVNANIEQMYQSAYGTYATNNEYIEGKTSDFLLRRPFRTVWEASDSSRYYWPGRPVAELLAFPKEEMYFNYEIILPKKDSLKINEYMAQDLNRFFGDLYGIEGIKENRKVKCWVLRRTSSRDLLATKGGEPLMLIHTDRKKLKVVNKNLIELFYHWAHTLQRYPIPIIDETGYKNNVDIDLDVDPSDFKAVSSAIRKYDLEFVLTERYLDMIVIRDKVHQ